jgi:hypothetical protein
MVNGSTLLMESIRLDSWTCKTTDEDHNCHMTDPSCKEEMLYLNFSTPPSRNKHKFKLLVKEFAPPEQNENNETNFPWNTSQLAFIAACDVDKQPGQCRNVCKPKFVPTH